MKVDVKKLERGQVELTVELPVEEYQPFLLKAAEKISREVKIAGFRPGKADFELVKQRVGEGEIWQAALEPAVKKTFPQALETEKLISVGSPHIDVVKLASGNPVIYKATVSLLPSVKLTDYSQIKIKAQPVVVSEDQVDKVLSDLQKRRAKEALISRPAQTGDKVQIDFKVFLDKIPIDNGSQNDFPLVLGEGSFIPGFEEQLVGVSQDQTKEFPLRFPETYHQKNLAGKLADFSVKVQAVYQRELPALNYEFAQGFGNFKTLAYLRRQLEDNLTHEAEHKEQQRLEEAMLEKLIEKSRFDEIPDLLVDSETKKMLEELEHNLEHQGVKFDDYLLHLKKKREDLVLDFVPQAIKRVKSALVTRAVAQTQNTNISDTELEEEIKKTLVAYGGNPEIEKQLQTPEYKNYVRNVLAAHKVMDHLKAVMVE